MNSAESSILLPLGEGLGEGLSASAHYFFPVWDNLESRALESFHVRVDIEE
jgi:hypothetical protein